MIRNRIKSIAAVVAFCAAFAYQASANIILLGETNLGNSGDATEEAWVKQLIQDYNTANNPDLPALPTPGVKTPIPDGPNDPEIKRFTYTVPDDCDFVYVLAKFGGGPTVITDYAWYLTAGETLVFPPLNEEQMRNALSHYVVWCGTNGVPDGGLTAVLLGLALTGLGASRRYLKK